MSRKIVVRVPASTSNLGAGFDCVGVAVDRRLTASFALDHGSRPVVDRAGTLAHLAIAPEDDRLVVGFRAACRQAGRMPPAGVHISAESGIPIARGLGSSAAATVAGAAAANALLGLGLADHDIARACAQVEGHADNVVPAIFGGARLAVAGADEALDAAVLPVHESIALVFAVPDFGVETAVARGVLPPEVPHATAARAAALGAALVLGLATADARLLAAALDDVLHTPFRRGLVRGYEKVADAARQAGAFGATLSGSGSTLVALAPRATAPAVADAMVGAWRALGVRAECFVNPGAVGGYRVDAHFGCEEMNRTVLAPEAGMSR